MTHRLPSAAPGRSGAAGRGTAGARAGLRGAAICLALRFVAAGPVAWVLTVTSVADAEEASVPASVQVALVGKLVGYDKHFAARAAGTARVVIVTMKGDGDSAREAGQLKASLSELDRLGGLPHEDSIVEYADPSALASRCRDQHVAVIWLTTGLAGEMDAIARALEGVSVLSVGAAGGYASRGAVIDFFTEGGKPKITLNLARARKQQVAFVPEVVRIMRVLE